MGKCEECNQKNATCGLPDDEKRAKRWCGACGKQHGAVNFTAKQCEKCNAKRASYGLKTEKIRRWYSSHRPHCPFRMRTFRERSTARNSRHIAL